jgi:hypothetical protein
MYRQKGYHAICPKCKWPIFYIRDSHGRIKYESDASLALLDRELDCFDYKCMRCGYLIDHKEAQKIKKNHHFTVNFEEEPEEEMFGVH